MSVEMLLLICYGYVIDGVECIWGMIMILCRREKKMLRKKRKKYIYKKYVLKKRSAKT